MFEDWMNKLPQIYPAAKIIYLCIPVVEIYNFHFSQATENVVIDLHFYSGDVRELCEDFEKYYK